MTTTGIVGFMAYLGMLATTVWTLLRMTRSGVITLKQCCCLAGAFVAYIVQNQFAFDTVATSVAFFALLAAIAALSQGVGCSIEDSRAGTAESSFPRCCRTVVRFRRFHHVLRERHWNMASERSQQRLPLLSCGSARSLGYFGSVKRLPFIFDPATYSAKLSAFAVETAASGIAAPALTETIVDQALHNQEDVTGRGSKDAIGHENLARLYVTAATLTNAPLDQRAESAIDSALALAPGRTGLLKERARIKCLRRDFSGAEAILWAILREDPQDKQAELQLASVYWYGGKREKGVHLAEEIFRAGYGPSEADELEWLGRAYEEAGDYARAARVYQVCVEIAPFNINDSWRLAIDYGKLGRRKEAIEVARGIESHSLYRAKEMDDFIASQQAQ